jgi:hypothetical protein
MNTYGGVEWFQPFLISALDGGEWTASRPCRFTPGETATGTHCIGARELVYILATNSVFTLAQHIRLIYHIFNVIFYRGSSAGNQWHYLYLCFSIGGTRTNRDMREKSVACGGGVNATAMPDFLFYVLATSNEYFCMLASVMYIGKVHITIKLYK